MALYVAGIAFAFAAGLLIRPALAYVLPPKAEPEQQSAQAPGNKRCGGPTHCKPGPWGELEYVPITFNAPAELPTVQSMMDSPAQWLFKGMDREEYARFVSSLEVPEAQREALLSADHVKSVSGSVLFTPTKDVLLTLPAATRERIYRLIANSPENNGYFAFVRARGIDERFRAGGVSDEVAARFRGMTCPHGRHLVFSGLQALLSTVPTQEERVRVVRVLTEQKSVLIKLKVDENTDVDSLARYWDKAGDSVDTRALLTAMKNCEGGASIDLVKLLPPVAASLVYTFPKEHARTAPVRRDCHWTAFNFFNDRADDGFGDSAYVEKHFMSEYVPAAGDYQYGDLIFMTRPDGSIVHSCIYVADDVVFTKNGANACHPWMFARTEDLIDLYSFAVEPSEKIELHYWRKKGL